MGRGLNILFFRRGKGRLLFLEWTRAIAGVLWMTGAFFGLGAVLNMGVVVSDKPADRLSFASEIFFDHSVSGGLEPNQEHKMHKEIVLARDIFEPFQETTDFLKEEESVVEDNEEPEQYFLDRYRVVAIIVDGQPQAVLRKTETGEIVFLSAGEVMAGAVVKQIEPGSIRFFYCGKEIRLRMQ